MQRGLVHLANSLARAALLLAACVLGLLASPGVNAQSLCGAWQPGPGYGTLDGPVRAFTNWDPDGNGPAQSVLVAGGSFLVAGNTLSNGVGTWNGTTWQNLGAGFNGAVRALAVWNGQLIAGGDFTSSGTTVALRIARWNGTSWQPLGAGMNGAVHALTVRQSQLYAGGEFTACGATPCLRVARWSGSAWSQVAAGFDAPVRALTVFNNDLIAGGDFGGVTFFRLAKWTGAGSWQPVDFSEPSGSVLALTVHQGSLIVGGAFTTIGFVATNGIASWNGATWSVLDFGLTNTPDSAAVTGVVSIGNDLYVGGRFNAAGLSPANSAARWDGARWHAMGAGFVGLDPVSAVGVFGGAPVVGGSFSGTGSMRLPWIASYEFGSWQPLLGAGSTTPRAVLAFAEHQDFLYAGTTTLVGERDSAQGVSVWSGGQWLQLPGAMNGPVRTLASYQGELYAAGGFLEIDGSLASRIARFDGGTWTPLYALDGQNEGTSGGCFVLREYLGQLIVGGWFSQAGGVAVGNIASWDGVVWRSLGVGVRNTSITNPQSWVSSLEVYNNELIVGGFFGRAGGQPAFNIARWNGAAWSAFAGDSITGGVDALCVYRGELYAGGTFFIGSPGSARTNITRWTGAAWAPAASGIVNGSVRALIGTQSHLFAGGTFVSAGGVPAQRIAAWDGSAWNSLGTGAFAADPGDGTTSAVSALACFEGVVVAGGTFSLVGSTVPVTNNSAAIGTVARWSGAPVFFSPLPAVFSPAVGGTILVSAFASGQGVLSYQWLHDGEAITDGAQESGAQFSGTDSSVLVMDFLTPAESGQYSCEVSNGCGTVRSLRAIVMVGGPGCDGLDFNHDGVSPDTQDILDFLAVFSGAACPSPNGCNDVDFNNDGVSPDSLDAEILLLVFAGGSC